MKKTVIRFIILSAVMLNAIVLSAALPDRSYDFKVALEGWAQTAVFGFGYEYDYNINHFYSITPEVPSSSVNKNSPVSDSNKYFDKLSTEVLREMYLEFYQNDKEVKYLVNYYKNKKDWRNFNHLSKKIEPDTVKYFQILEDYVKKTPRCSDFANDAALLKSVKRKGILIQVERLTTIETFD